MLRDMLANDIFKLPPEQFLVRSTDVGGGFGMKLFMYPEYPATLYAARKFGRPVKWTSERTEAFISDDHGRDNVTTVELAVDKDARFLALRVDLIANMGAYLSNFAPFIPTMAGGAQMLTGLYTLQGVYERVRGVFTNTQPVDAYRGAGRPEAAYNVERIVDHAARVLGIDPVELRRRNFIPPSAMPYATVTGVTYDSGEFTRNLEEAAQIADVAGFEARRARISRARASIAGSASPPMSRPAPAARTRPPMSGSPATARSRSMSAPRPTARATRPPTSRSSPSISASSPTRSPSSRATPTWSAPATAPAARAPSRSAAPRSATASLKVQDKAKLRAADLLETAAVDIAFVDGRFTVVGTDRGADPGRDRRPDRDGRRHRDRVEERGSFAPPSATFPNGAHIVELEIDRDTGALEILRYTVVDDFGRVLNPLMVTGQVHGGIAQGLGQALLEHAVLRP